ncbi:MAG: hypothetical protein A3C06_00600 [Candidatus Taylorbacteria bacterium RIFCSPHIGHO2_02_FULL_46_13]|uniref:Type II toxin-antitoxin system HicB family antitoxin n=1 Tax=Candidatus Taylorbacteria bacterium RIFCSPHIGHO2_02_FULL_46_13 TaxID=1802312 RepID=A0A1G2MU03_9BACT|nr:MAG: hypothetical protein A3C06_00600 [Candidatus Taylorbacteria bacterium RIFCSPHIGHO2_02_FULL_46_13]
MKHIIQFSITKEDNIYTASGVDVPIVTEGKTFEELQDNICDAVKLYFEDEDPAELGFASSPAVLTNFELTSVAYGRKA